MRTTTTFVAAFAFVVWTVSLPRFKTRIFKYYLLIPDLKRGTCHTVSTPSRAGEWRGLARDYHCKLQ
jgi:hypothetical protein